MKKITAFHIAWVLVGCVFAEIAYMVVQIGLTMASSGQNYSLHEMLSPTNPFYAIPPDFFIVSVLFFAAMIYGAARHIYNIAYYMIAAVIVGLIYYICLRIGGHPVSGSIFIINFVATLISGSVYWVVAPRHIKKH